MVYETRPPFVLIVEDDRDIAAYYRLVLDQAGFRTDLAGNGKEAVEYLHKSPPDIVLLDLGLPGVSGVEVLKLLKSEDRLKKTRAVVVTGYSEIANDLTVAPDLILMKPVTSNQLTDLVWRMCQEDKTFEKRPFGKNAKDKTTGLYNRPFFINRLGCALKNCKENRDNLFGVLLVSPDPGESIRTKPEEQGKEFVLRETEKILKASIRPTDTIARFDGDHFFILIEHIHSAEILSMIANRIQPASGNRSAEEIRYNIGAVLCDDSYHEIDEILRNVKTAHSLAKTGGQMGCRIFSSDAMKASNNH